MGPDPLPTLPLRMGISSCLLGNPVRYDSSHRHNAYVTQTLGAYFDFVPFCPEVAIGLGTPRPPIQLVDVEGSTRVRGTRDPDQDVTEALIGYGRTLAHQLDGVSGYLLKQGSPSCGMEGVKVYDCHSGRPIRTSAGMFAKTLMQARPELPVEEEGRLADPRLRENFIERVFIYHRWRGYRAAGITPARLVEFHRRHRLNILAHDQPGCRSLDRLVAEAGRPELQSLADEYIRSLMQALARIATPQQHTTVLMYVMGALKDAMDDADRTELLELIDAYRREQVPLVVPMALLHHHLRSHPNDDMEAHYYLNPHPCELMLRHGT